MQWTQPSCADCFAERNPGRTPVTLRPEYAEAETCCHCGKATAEGIYVRVDPRTVPFPREDDA